MISIYYLMTSTSQRQDSSCTNSPMISQANFIDTFITTVSRLGSLSSDYSLNGELRLLVSDYR
jgi:hypothetical protein